MRQKFGHMFPAKTRKIGNVPNELGDSGLDFKAGCCKDHLVFHVVYSKLRENRAILKEYKGARAYWF